MVVKGKNDEKNVAGHVSDCSSAKCGGDLGLCFSSLISLDLFDWHFIYMITLLDHITLLFLECDSSFAS